MDVKRFFRGPWLWIVVAVVGVLIALQYLAPNGGYRQINTSQMVQDLRNGSAQTVLFVDGDQEVRATLTNGDKVTASWVQGQQRDLVNLTQKQVQAGNIKEFNVEVP